MSRDFEIFAQAPENLSPSAFAAYLDEACAGDDDLRARVEELVVAESEAQRFMGKPPVPRTSPNAAAVGTAIGSYKLLEQLGEGGFGVVYMAEQREPVKRRVALKVLKAGMDTKQVIARFEAERQALAMMDHPNIARVLDAGETDSGRPYFVMDLVSGLPVTDYCNQRRLTTEERLEIFKQICAAVQHAHQKGIIHRDLKPGNILVSTDGDTPVPKVIDFGIAKATQGRLTDKTLFTQFRHFVGTPEYMSPEQIQLSPYDVDTRSDVYALGILLYELLAGVRPVASETIRRAGYEEMCRRLREDLTPRPSRRLTSLPPEELTTLASQRQLTVAQFKSSIRGELEWIILKAVEKDRSRRYESCAALAADVQRYQKREPVQAGRPSAAYHFRKFLQRHRAASLAVAVVAASLVLGATLAIHGRWRAEAAKQDALNTVYLADMHVAHKALDERNFSLASRLLERHRTKSTEHDPRHWEWHALQRRSRSNTERIFHRQGSAISINVSPSGQWVADGREGHLGAWDLFTSEYRTLYEHSGDPNPLAWAATAFAPDGSVLFGNIGDGIIRSWNVPGFTSTGLAMKVASQGAPKMIVSRDGQELLLLGKRLEVWDVSTGKLLRRYEHTHTRLGQMTLSPDGSRLAVGVRDGGWKTVILDYATFDERAVIDAAGRSELTFSPDGQCLASSLAGANASSFTVHRVRDGQLLAKRDGHLHTLSGLAYSPDNRYLATASGDQTAVLWDAQTYEKLATLHGANKQITEITFTPDSKRILSCSQNGRICVWKVAKCLEQKWPVTRMKVVRYGDWFRQHSQISVSPDGKLLATTRFGAGREGDPFGVALLSPHSLETERVIASGQVACGVRFSPAESLLVIGDLSGHLIFHDPNRDHELARELLMDSAEVFPTRFTQDGSQLLVIGRNESAALAAIYDVKRRKRAYEWKLPPNAFDAVVAPDGRHVVTGHDDGIWIWPNADPDKATFLEMPVVSGVDISPDSQLLAVSHFNGRISMIDLATQETVGECAEHVSHLCSVRFSPDGKRLASTGNGEREAVKLWDVASRRELLTLRTPGASHRQIEWSPDQKAIFLDSGGGGRLSVWRVPD